MTVQIVPFKFVSFTRDVNLLVERNQNYWQKGRPYLDAIDSLFIADPTTKLNLMKSGGADMILAEPGKRAADIEAAVVPVAAGGKLWCVQPYVMDLGLNQRTMPNYFNNELTWLNKK